MAALFGLSAVFLFYQILGGGLSALIFGFDPSDDDLTALRLMTAAGEILFILLPALLLSGFFYRDISSVIRLNRPSVKELLLFSAGMLVLILLLQTYMYVQDFLMDQAAGAFPWFNGLKTEFDKYNQLVEKEYDKLIFGSSLIEKGFIVIIVAVVPAVCEEAFFRGFVQGSFQMKYSGLVSALITSLFFALYHMHPYQLLPLAALGFYFGFASYKSDSIWIPVLLHFLNNFVAVVLFFIVGADDIVDVKGAGNNYYFQAVTAFLVLLVIFISIVMFINYHYKREYSAAINSTDRIDEDM
ncbi:MAG: type II CAAX prenyl endopeptidase Rce1 family protein [Bacteroidota bacterium]